MDDKLLTVEQAANLLSIHPVTLRRLSGLGKVSGCRKIGGKWYYDRQAIEDYIKWGSVR